MENEIVSIMEKIEKDSEKLKQIFGIKEMDELYKFFKENGYKQSFEKFKVEVTDFMESVGFVSQTDSSLENISGGSSAKNKLTKATSVSLASLLAFGSPVSYASRSEVPGKAALSSNGWLNSSLAKKLIKIGIPASLLTVGGIGTIALIVWKCIKHNDSTKKEATEKPNSNQIDGDNVQRHVTSDLSQEEEKENLIRDVLGKDMVQPFKCVYYKEKVIELVRKIQEILGTDANNLGALAHDEACFKIKELVTNYNNFDCSYRWFNYICSALCGYLHREHRQDIYRFMRNADMAPLILSFALCNENDENREKMKKVKDCIDYLYKNLDKYICKYDDIDFIESYMPSPDPDDLINAIRKLKSDKAAKLYTVNPPTVLSFAYLIAQFPGLGENLGNLHFKHGEDTLTFEEIYCGKGFKAGNKNFEILKENGESIGTFRFNYNSTESTTTLEKLEGERVSTRLRYSFEDGKIYES